MSENYININDFYSFLNDLGNKFVENDKVKYGENYNNKLITIKVKIEPNTTQEEIYALYEKQKSLRSVNIILEIEK